MEVMVGAGEKTLEVMKRLIALGYRGLEATKELITLGHVISDKELSPSDPYIKLGESIRHELAVDPEGEKRYRVIQVITKTGDAEAEALYAYFEEGEWRIIDLIQKKVVMTFPWRNNYDPYEDPPRCFQHGVADIAISEDETELRCYYTFEHSHGFKFEGQTPVDYESHKLPPDEVSTDNTRSSDKASSE